MCHSIIKFNSLHYRPQRSCGQGNVFTGVCHSFCSQGGGGLPQCMLGYPPRPGRHPPLDQADPPDQTPPRIRHPPDQIPRPGRHPPDQVDTPQIRQTPLNQEDTPGTRQTSPLGTRQTPAYGLRAAGTHPTGMHSCFIFFYLSETYCYLCFIFFKPNTRIPSPSVQTKRNCLSWILFW